MHEGRSGMTPHGVGRIHQLWKNAVTVRSGGAMNEMMYNDKYCC